MGGERVRVLKAVAALVVAMASPALAQVPWESPQLLAPSAPGGLSALYVDFGLRPNDGTGVLVMFRSRQAPGGPGLRFAATIPDGDDARFSGGLDFSVPMFRHSSAFPLDVIWTSGIGGGYGDHVSLALPVGFAAGRTVTGDNIWFNPYMSTRIVFEAFLGSDRPSEEFGLALAADLGFDLAFDANRAVVLRTAMSLGDRRALAVGLHASLGR
jgi:hypothetical protein